MDADRLGDGLAAYWLEADRLANWVYDDADAETLRLRGEIQAQRRQRWSLAARSLAERYADPVLWRFALALDAPHYGGADPARSMWLEVQAILRARESQPPTDPPKSGAEPLVDQGDALDDLPDDATMNHVDLANQLKLDREAREALRKRLDRWREKNADGWQEIADAKAREPKYLYRVGAIRHLLRDAT